MLEPGPRRGRTHDAEGAQEAILNAAEKVFAEHGFDGARIDAIAAEADYNKSLIFHYFGDKLGLYAEVIRRADKHMSEMQVKMFEAMAQDKNISSMQELKALLRTAMYAFFDYLIEHPHFVRIFSWEMAEGFQIYAKIISQRDRDDIDQFRNFLSKVPLTEMLRSDFNPTVQFVMGMYLCQHYLSSLPLYQLLLPDEDFSSHTVLTRMREYVVEFVLSGMFIDSANG
jgi:AcrR family transcriptional regulator